MGMGEKRKGYWLILNITKPANVVNLMWFCVKQNTGREMKECRDNRDFTFTFLQHFLISHFLFFLCFSLFVAVAFNKTNFTRLPSWMNSRWFAWNKGMLKITISISSSHNFFPFSNFPFPFSALFHLLLVLHFFCFSFHFILFNDYNKQK